MARHRNAQEDWRKAGGMEKLEEGGRATDKAVYTKAERECKRMIRNKKNAYEWSIAKSRNYNPKQYYSYVNSAKKNRSRFGPLKNDDGEFVVEPKQQAESMNRCSLVATESRHRKQQ